MNGLDPSRLLTTHSRLAELRRKAQEHRAVATALSQRRQEARAAQAAEPRFTWELPSSRSARPRAWYARLRPSTRRYTE